MPSSNSDKQWQGDKPATARTNQSATPTEPRSVAGLKSGRWRRCSTQPQPRDSERSHHAIRARAPLTTGLIIPNCTTAEHRNAKKDKPLARIKQP